MFIGSKNGKIKIEIEDKMGLFSMLNSAFEEFNGLDFESQAKRHRGWSLENRAQAATGDDGCGVGKALYLYPDDGEILRLERKRSLWLWHRGRICIWGDGEDCHIKNLSFNSAVAAKQHPCTELVIVHGDHVTFDNCTFNGKGLRCAVHCECKSIEFTNCIFKKCGHRGADQSIVKIKSLTKGNLHCKAVFSDVKFTECTSAESIIEADSDLSGDVHFEKCHAGAEIIRATHANHIRIV